jgi:hypothetical protein
MRLFKINDGDYRVIVQEKSRINAKFSARHSIYFLWEVQATYFGFIN